LAGLDQSVDCPVDDGLVEALADGAAVDGHPLVSTAPAGMCWGLSANACFGALRIIQISRVLRGMNRGAQL